MNWTAFLSIGAIIMFFALPLTTESIIGCGALLVIAHLGNYREDKRVGPQAGNPKVNLFGVLIVVAIVLYGLSLGGGR